MPVPAFSTRSLTFANVAETSSMVAESSSMTAEISVALPLTDVTLSVTAAKVEFKCTEESRILAITFCNASIKVLTPSTRLPISSFWLTEIRLVRSAAALLTSSTISPSSLEDFLTGVTISRTLINTTIIKISTVKAIEPAITILDRIFACFKAAFASFSSACIIFSSSEISDKIPVLYPLSAANTSSGISVP